MAPYTEPASNSVETTAPGSGRGADTGRWVPPHAATPPARNAIAAARLTCSTSNPGVSFARSHAQREPRRSDHRRLPRSEEHTSELQSQSNLVCRLLLEKKKKILTSTVDRSYKDLNSSELLVHIRSTLSR